MVLVRLCGEVLERHADPGGLHRFNCIFSVVRFTLPRLQTF